jgi:hypothetical protein
MVHKDRVLRGLLYDALSISDEKQSIHFVFQLYFFEATKIR